MFVSYLLIFKSIIMNHFNSQTPLFKKNSSRDIEFEILGMEQQFRKKNENFSDQKVEEYISYTSEKIFEVFLFFFRSFARLLSYLFEILKSKKARPFIKYGTFGLLIYFIATNKSQLVQKNESPSVIIDHDENNTPKEKATFEVLATNLVKQEKPESKKPKASLNPQLNRTAIAYIDRFEIVAKTEMSKFGIPASIKMAQALLESNVGKSKLSQKNNNHFGLKCFSKICSKNHCSNMSDDHHKDFFRNYSSSWESWRDHSKFLNSERYLHLQSYGNDYKKWAEGLQKAGYATDKNYGRKLIKLIEKYRLYDLDIISPLHTS